jgi:hypothetical protein
MSNQVKSKDVRRVIEGFKSVVHLAHSNDSLDMEESSVEQADNDIYGIYTCGTTHCHAGWYAVAHIEEVRELIRSTYGKRTRISFVDGVLLMESHLGIEKGRSISSWADHNPELWGNDSGQTMFSRASAFTSPSRPKGARNLQDIIDHWTEVAERLEALEKQEEESNQSNNAVISVQTLIDNPISVTYNGVELTQAPTDNSVVEYEEVL